MDALDLLTAIGAAIPDAKISLVITEPPVHQLLVGVCHQNAPLHDRFYNYLLDDEDMQRSPDAIAAELAPMHAERRRNNPGPPKQDGWNAVVQ